MPYRRIPLVSGEVYHVFNRSIAKQPIFNNADDYNRILDLVNYYRFKRPPLRFSHYKRLTREQKTNFIQTYMTKNRITLNIIAYCIMPNHFHFLLKPLEENALSDFMRNIQNGYSKYFNLKYERTGSLFQFMFKAVRIESDEQLVHVSRYIHLNPVTSYIIKVNGLEIYPWSSIKDYLLNSEQERKSFVDPEIVIDHFISRENYKKFVLDQVNYQRELDKIKHFILE